MGTNYAPLVSDLLLFCHERDFTISLSDDNQVDIIDNPYFEGLVNQMYPPKLQLNKANATNTDAPFLDLNLSIPNGFVSSKMYDKHDDFDIDIVNLPFWIAMFPVKPLMGYTFQAYKVC